MDPRSALRGPRNGKPGVGVVRASRPTESLPGFTVVVPTRARRRRLDLCLQSLADLDYPRERLQVVVVDDASPKSPQDIIDQYRNRLDVELLGQEKAGPAVARNAGARRARHEYVAFTDDDCAPHPEWLRELASAFRARPETMLGGSTTNALEGNLFAEASQELVSYLYEYFNAAPNVRFLTSNNMALPADLFLELGGFSASFPVAAAEDRDLCDRWLNAGGELGYAPDAIVLHSHELGLASFWRQHFGYGRGAHGYHRRRARRGSKPVRLEPVRFYTGLLAYPLKQRRGLASPAISVLLFLSQVANAAGYFYEKALSPWRSEPVISEKRSSPPPRV